MGSSRGSGTRWDGGGEIWFAEPNAVWALAARNTVMALVGWSCNTIFGLMLLAAPSPKPNYSAALDEKSGKSIYGMSLWLSSTICVSRLSSIILFSSNFAPLVFVYVYILHFSIRIRFAISIGVSICLSIRLELRIGGRAKTSDEGQKGPLFSRFYDGAKSKTDLRSSKC